MNSHRLLQLIRYRLFLGLAMAATIVQAEPGQLIHQPVKSTTEGLPLTIQVAFTPAALRVYQVRVYFRIQDQTTFRFRQMVPDTNGWSATIPAAEVRGSRLQYFISAAVENDLILLYPEINPYNRPEEVQITPAPAQATIAIPEKAAPVVEEAKSVKMAAMSAAFPEIVLKQTSPDTLQKEPIRPSSTNAADVPALSPILILSPEENETIAAKEVLLAISLVSGNGEVDSSSVKIWLDGADVTSLTSISPSLVTYEPKHLKKGKHTLQVDAKTSDGIQLPAASLHFKIAEEEVTAQAATAAKTVQVHVFTDMRSEEVMKKSSTFYVGGVDFSGQLKNLQFEGNVSFTSLEKKTAQPVNNYHLALHNKWLGFSAGDNHPMYNDLILWGKRVRGLSGYVHLGFINLDFVTGETNRAVEGRLLAPTGIVSRAFGTFKQNLIGIRPSFGSGKRYQLGLSVVKVKDAVGSITHGSMPKDNLVFGPDLKLSFDRGRFMVEASAAMSFLTENTAPGSITSNDVSKIFGSDTELPIDPSTLSRYLIINESTTPLDPLQKSSMAYNGLVKLDYFHNLLQLGYKSIGAGYMSLANSWLRKDLEGLYFTDRLRLLENKLYVTLGYEDYIDNFSQQNANPSVSLKTFNYSVTFYPKQGLPQLTVSMRDHYRDNGVQTVTQSISFTGTTSDTLVVDNRDKQIFRDLSAQVGYDVRLFDLAHTINFSYVSSRNMDEYSNSRLPGSFARELSTGVLLFTLNTQFTLPLKTNISFASNRNSGSLRQGNLDYIMFGGSAEYGFWHNRMTVLVDGRRTHMAGINTTSRVLNRDQARLAATFQIAPRHTVLLDANFVKMRSINFGALGSYIDKVIRVRYDRYF